MVPSFAWNRERSGAIRAELAVLRSASSTDLALALITSVMENASEVYGAADGTFVSDVFGADLPLRLDGCDVPEEGLPPVARCPAPRPVL